MNELLAHIRSKNSYQDLVGEIESQDKSIQLGLMGSARLPIAAALQQDLERPALLLSHRRDRALNYFDEMALWEGGENYYFFPEPSSLFYENAAWGEIARRERLNVFALLALSEGQDFKAIISTSSRAFMARTISRERFVAASSRIKIGDQIDPVRFANLLFRSGYESSFSVTAVGQFARRGGIVDLWPMQSESPVRLEFFGDELESLRQFDAASQRTIRTIQNCLIPPAREFVIEEKTPQGLERDEIGEFHIPILHPEGGSLLEFLPERSLIFIDDRQAFLDSVDEFEAQAVDLRKQQIKNGELDPAFPVPYFTVNEIEEMLSERPVIELGPSASLDEASAIASAFRPGRRFGGRLKVLNDEIEKFLLEGDEVHIFSRQAVRLDELWTEKQFDNPGKSPKFTQSSVSEGWSLSLDNQKQIHFLSDGEIFGWDKAQIRRRPRLQREAPETPYVDLKASELVVHIDHGIGIFKGLVEREIEGVEREFLQVAYAEDDQLYVPVHQADRLTRYVGGKGEIPNLNRLGGVEWRTVKSRVKEAVEAIAEDLLELYALRETVKGHSFSPDSEWQKELEAAFPYIETDDQTRVIAEVKADMESDGAMDRLVCGDAGYGKTEVALRAAFKAVMDGKQVALLVPTTVLAQQHFETFRKRLAAFPVRVEMLSRFRTAKEQKDIIGQLSTGEMDIVIGTHRLLQSDVAFKDLGLLIIDEEQRFGVTHKEYLKKYRTEVDVLTMTATPIPRTLYMALTGVRDISTISTPPEERLPVVTHVGPYSPDLVRQSVIREMDRGGQVFFVHNRVQTIDSMKARLKNLIPEARISIAHGQMAEKDLAERMMQFSGGEIDILLTTTIIESGLDIPNANTLIIDRADRFGLAQLYQLRGRVGRGAQRAYAYFFKHTRRKASDESLQRLETIAENSQRGAGFSVAMRDLEIRGAGDLLGSRQHGLMAAVGFHLYTRLLTKAVEDMRKSGAFGAEKAAAQISLYHPMINVDLPLEIGIPEDYVPDKGMRLRLYRRLADLHDISEISALEEEFEDRFGTPAPEVLNLFFQLKVKVMAEEAGLSAIARENKQLALRFPNQSGDDKSPRQFPALPGPIRSSKNTIWIYGLEGNEWQDTLLTTLETLAAHNNNYQVA